MSGAVAAVNTTTDHLTALLTAAIRTTDVTCKRQITSFHPVSTPAQVDREQGLVHSPRAPDAVEDRHDIARGQSQGTTSSRISHEGSLCLTQSKHLICHRDVAHLDTQESC